MRIDLDAKVRTRDGEDAGKVRSAVYDHARNAISGFVVSTGGLLGREVIVPRELLETASKDGEVLHLEITKDELDDVPSYVSDEYTDPPPAWIPPSGYVYPTAGYLWPIGFDDRIAPARYPTPSEEMNAELRESQRTVHVEKGSKVIDVDGDDLGVVEDVRLDSDNGEITGVVIRYGGTLQTLFGGGDKLEVPGTLIERVDDAGAVRLLVRKDELRRAA